MPAYSAVATASTAGATTLTVTFASAPASDTLLIAFASTRGGTSRTLSPTTGTWTLINRTDQGASISMFSWWRLGDGTTTGFSFSSNSSVDDWGVAVMAITGVNTGAPIGATAENAASTGSGVTVNLTTLYASAGAPSLIAHSWNGVVNNTWTPDANATERWDFKSGTFSNVTMGGGHDTSNMTSNGSISRTWTTSSGANVAQLIEVRAPDIPRLPSPIKRVSGLVPFRLI